MQTRRRILGSMLAVPLAGATVGARATAAPADGDPRLVYVVLRGGLDGLAAVPPVGDAAHERARGGIALPRGEALDLDGHFALHPALRSLHALHAKGELLALHAVASPYRERSHFDAQNVLELGLAQPHAARDGWLNRALPLLRAAGLPHAAIAMGPAVPLSLQGPESVASWAPASLPDPDDNTMAQLRSMYDADAFLAPRLRAALSADAMAAEGGRGPRAAGPGGALMPYVQATARFLAHAAGPRIAVLEAGGFDTHANQGGAQGQLANRLRQLDEALSALPAALGTAWSRTAVLVVSEFGRTVAMNGTRGTDHGTAGVAFLLGGAVRGGRVVADWPGLGRDALHEGRDLAPTLDVRAIYKAVLVDHLGLTRADVERGVLPGSERIAPLDGLLRS
jgi:uncharacterized protein (DUF1501 family)